jgi:superfamily I DNA and/or RNA helicase
METTVDDGSSKRNEFEGKYVIELVQYLIKQDYKPEQITILVMYLGQRQFIAKQAKQKNILRGVRIMVLIQIEIFKKFFVFLGNR